VTRYRRSPRSLVLALAGAQHDWAPATLLASVQAVWPDVVGAAIATEATPVSEKAGVLTVSCSAAVWAQELDLMAPTILGRLNAKLRGAGRVSRLRCVATPPRR
jgi:predicted nucleic acid-binding Zn ribbon protein